MATQTTRLSIDMNPKDHRKLKILADANGLSLKDFLLIVLEPYLHPNKKPNKNVSHMWEELGLDE